MAVAEFLLALWPLSMCSRLHQPMDNKNEEPAFERVLRAAGRAPVDARKSREHGGNAVGAVAVQADYESLGQPH